jgi:phosphoenolpyruvate carboxykinase (ATP)
MVRAILAGALDGVAFTEEPYFGLLTPESCPDVPADLLRPHEACADHADYENRTRRLAELFHANFETYHAPHVAAAVRQAGPRI